MRQPKIQTAAINAKQYAAANSALKLKAELSGHNIQRKEDVTPRLSEAEIDARLCELLAGGEAGSSKLLVERRSLEVRRSLIEWCRFCGYEPAAHHRLLVSELEKVARGETVRLAIFMPPGSAKSTYASVLFPPWLLASSNWNILAASHTTELAEKWGRRIRNLISEHSSTLGISLAADSQAAGRWSLAIRCRVLRCGRRDWHRGVSSEARPD